MRTYPIITQKNISMPKNAAKKEIWNKLCCFINSVSEIHSPMTASLIGGKPNSDEEIFIWNFIGFRTQKRISKICWSLPEGIASIPHYILHTAICLLSIGEKGIVRMPLRIFFKHSELSKRPVSKVATSKTCQ